MPVIASKLSQVISTLLSNVIQTIPVTTIAVNTTEPVCPTHKFIPVITKSVPLRVQIPL